MIKDKIKIIVKNRNRLLKEFMPIFNVSTPQALNTKFKRNTIMMSEIIELCSVLNYSLEIRDKKTRKIIAVFDEDDLNTKKETTNNQ